MFGFFKKKTPSEYSVKLRGNYGVVYEDSNHSLILQMEFKRKESINIVALDTRKIWFFDKNLKLKDLKEIEILKEEKDKILINIINDLEKNGFRVDLVS